MEIGTQLRRAREAMGLTLEDVQQKTKIHAEYLQALERDRFDSLPSPFYVRAFLRTYARCLGMDPQPLLDRYERLNQGGADPAASFRRTRPLQGGGYRSNTGRFRTAPPLSATGPNPRVASASERPSQHTGPFRPAQSTGRFHTVQQNAVTGGERAVGEETRPPVSSRLPITSRPSGVSQHTGRFRTGSYPIVKQDGQALPQPRSASGSRPSASQQGGGKRKEAACGSVSPRWASSFWVRRHGTGPRMTTPRAIRRQLRRIAAGMAEMERPLPRKRIRLSWCSRKWIPAFRAICTS